MTQFATTSSEYAVEIISLHSTIAVHEATISQLQKMAGMDLSAYDGVPDSSVECPSCGRDIGDTRFEEYGVVRFFCSKCNKGIAGD